MKHEISLSTLSLILDEGLGVSMISQLTRLQFTFIIYIKFIIYINDLPGVVSDIADANGNKLCKVIHSVHDQECFQQDLNKINEWCVTNKMRFNARKCKVVKITKKKSPFSYDYHIDGAKLDSVSFHRDLGLLTSNTLSWNIANITAKTNRCVGIGYQ